MEKRTGRPILILGVGNPLRGDDGIGPAAIEALGQLELPPDVELVDGGTAGLGLLGVIAQRERVLMVDAAEMGRPAGTVACVLPEQVLVAGPHTGQVQGKQRFISAHQAGLVELLAVARRLGIAPKEIRLFAVQPSSLRWGKGLSPAVRECLPHLVAAIQAEVER